MTTLNLNNELFIDEVIKDFFNESEMQEYTGSYSIAGNENYEKNENKDFTGNDDDFSLRIENLIAYSENKLSEKNFLSLLIRLGSIAASAGVFKSAAKIYNRIITETEGDKNYNNIRANALFAIANILTYEAQLSKSIQYADEAIGIFNDENDFKSCAKCENLLGSIYSESDNLPESKIHFEKSLAYLNKIQDYNLKGLVEINLGIINTIQGKLDPALSYYRRAQLNFQRTGNIYKIAEIHYNTGTAYLKKREYELALIEFDLCIAIAQKKSILPMLGITYLSKAYIYVHLGDMELAESFISKSMEISFELDDQLSVAEVYRVKGIIQRYLKNFELAENYLLTSLRINQENHNELNKAETSYELGMLYKETNRKEESNFYFNDAINYFRKIQAEQEIKNIEGILVK